MPKLEYQRKITTMYELWLASQSPRRRELLQKAGFLFRIHPVKISENIEENVNPERAIMAIAHAKANEVVRERKLLKPQNILLLAADTMVILPSLLGLRLSERLLGKPKTTQMAREYLTLLSGKAHRVVTAISLFNFETDEFLDTFESTNVQFRELSESEIEAYVSSGEPLDKAGAYAIQGGARSFVTAIEGSESNVIGLPLELFEKILRERGWQVARK